jgi:hypothetical protein
MQLECGCEVSEDGMNLLSMCSMHAGHMKKRQEIERVPRNVDEARRAPISGDAKELRDKLLVAAMPTCVEMLARGTDAETVAQGVTELIHQIQRRCE